MSFILDALKKAEAERHQRVAPVLMDARITPPRRGLPAWAWALGAVLLVNLVLLGVVLWRSPAAPVAAPAGQPAPAEAAGAVAPSPATAARPAPAPAAPAAPALPGATPVTPPASVAPPPALPASARAPVVTPAFDALPTLHELRASGVSLPDLQLQLHAWSPEASERSVLLNGQRLREGEYTPNGVKLERITPDGVVLEASGRSFRLETGP